MATRRVYKKPPIQEAICDIRYSERDGNDLRDLPKFLSHVSDAYSGPVLPVFQIQPSQGASVVPGQGINLSLAIDGPNLQIWSTDRRMMLTLGRDRIATHALAPYCGWEEFNPQVLAAHDAFTTVYSPKAVMRIGVRYVNRVVLPLTNFDISEYFVGVPTVALRSAAVSRVLSRIEGDFPTSHDQFGITFGSAESEPDSVAFLLDIEVYRSFEPSPMHGDAVSAEIERLRNEERELFEAMITDKARALFDA
jgi:uncharacterized protein (TIGR04255 family)